MKKVLGFIAMLAVGGLLGYVGATLVLGDREPDGVPVLPEDYGTYLLLLLPVIYLVVVGIHELGHVLAGRWQNFKFYNLTIGPFAWKLDDDDRVRFVWNKNLNVAGGVAVMLPNGSNALRKRFMWFAAGGPLASLVLAMTCYPLAQVFGETSFLRFVAYTTAALSIVIFIATILPFRTGGFASDGLRILTFARNGATALADLTGLRALAHLRAGKAYDELPVEEMAAVSANEEVPGQQRVTMDYYRYLHAIGVGDIAKANSLFTSVMDRLDVYPSGTHGNFFLEEALFSAKYLNDLPAAEAAMEKVTSSPMTEPLSIHLANAAIAELKGDAEALATELPGIEKGLARSMDQSRVSTIRTWLSGWKDLVAKG
ncbi:M50 family metallopeptidase [Neolewinella persica]|uniref:M50 family metallopeptidase n=1 Tax=Neolewinella persica TaxID=70998 RepID=UPI00036000DC|nr:M50 family metallopeptidase [Neolewinella persica]